MKLKIILIVFLLLLVGGSVGGYLYYNSVLRFTDDFTDCPVKAFRSAVTAPAAAQRFAVESSYGTLKKTEKCSLDCMRGNAMACAAYGLALQYGVFVLQGVDEAENQYKQACDGGASIGCELAAYIDQLAAEKERAAAAEALKQANVALLAKVQEAKQGAAMRWKQALDHFKGKGPMFSQAMVKWNNDTFHFLLYETPRLAQKHPFPGSAPLPEDLDLKAFITAKYLTGAQGLKADEMLAFLDEFRKLGIRQIRLDHYVENQKESEIPKNHNYFRAKHTFLYHLADVEIALLGELEKRLASTP